MEPRFFEQIVHFDSEEDVAVKQKVKKGVLEDNDDCFSCNICLDSAHNPIVTLYGHLYC